MTKTNMWMTGCGIPVFLIISFCGYLVYSIFNTPENRIARNPEKISNLAGFELPEYKVISKTDNMDRTSSAWSDYTWTIRIKTPVEKEIIKSLDSLVHKNKYWTYDSRNKAYLYKYPDIDPSAGYIEPTEIHISVDIITGIIVLDYAWWDTCF